MTVVLDIDPEIAHRFAYPDPDPRLGFTVCGIRFAWASPRSKNKAKRCHWCWA